MTWQLLIRGARVFDGTGAAPVHADVAVAGGRIAAVGPSLEGDAERIIDGTGQWLMPGLLDIHTHVDLEVEVAPGLEECLRHGTTSVVMGNCSLGLAFGNQRRDGADPIVDCFARVENVPKSVLSKVGDGATWTEPPEYLEHLDQLPLGINVAPLLPHSMLRIHVMGLDAAISRDPTEAELDRMETVVEEAMALGYVGLSTDALPFHYLANDPNRRVRIPTQHASKDELRRILDVVRRHEGVWQATPPKDKPSSILTTFMLTSGLLYGKPLKTTAVAAMDLTTSPMLLRLGKVLTFLMNRVLGGDFRLQSLAAPFRTWADGPITPLAEEVDELRLLNEPDLEDRDARRAILRDPAYRAAFRRMWTHRGLKARLGADDIALTRDLADMHVDRAPVSCWAGQTMATIHARLERWQSSGEGALDADEATAFAAFPKPCDPCDFFLHLLEVYDIDLSWWTITANRDEATVKSLLLDPRFIPGFADSGAHLANMAFYDVNLRALQIVQEDGEEAVARMVHRLTREPAELFGLDAGRLEEGARADLVLLDPVALAAWDRHDSVIRVHREAFGHEQLVNRSDGVVSLAVVGGKVAWEADGPAPGLGVERMGRLLRARGVGRPSSVPAAPPAEPVVV